MAPSNVKKYARLIGLTVLGGLFEWYDFVLYIHLAPLFATIFLPESALFDTTVLIYGIHIVNLLMRPLGGVVVGIYGDRFGRRSALILTIVCITVVTGGVGLLPSYGTIGVVSTAFLLLFRGVQAFAIGGEIPGMISMLVESAPKNRRGFIGSFTFVGSQLGVVLAVLTALFLKGQSQEVVSSWLWRLPFILGGVVGLFGFYIRRGLHETPLFESAKRNKELEAAPMRKVFGAYKKQLMQACGVWLLSLVSFSLVFNFMNVNLYKTIDITYRQGLWMTFMIYAESAVLLPLIGYLSDKVGRKPILIGSSAVIAIVSHPLLVLILKGSAMQYVVGMAVLSALLSFQYAVVPTLLSEIFPTPVRYIGLGVSYNVMAAFFAVFTPAFTLMLFKWLEDPVNISPYLVGAAVISFVMITGIKDTKYLKHT